jgi:hypothetical protein
VEIVHTDDSGVSDIVATVLIIAIVVVILSSAMYVIDVGLPNRTMPSASIVDNNVSFHFITNNTGYLEGSFLYQTGPVLSNGSAYFTVTVNSSVFSYSISSFHEALNSWNEITSGTVVTFNSSVMRDQNGQVMPLLTSGENYSMGFKDRSSSIWSYSGEAVPSSSKPIIAYSWFEVSGV